MAWTVEIARSAQKRIAKLDRLVQLRIVEFLKTRVATPRSPRRIGKALKGDHGEVWRYRVGDYCLICRIEDDQVIVLVLAVSHRSRAYRH